MKSKFARFNVLILISLFIIITLCLCLIFMGGYPSKIKTRTGIISKYDHYEKKWYDDYLPGTTYSYFNIEFEDGIFFQATGISYDNIDKELFDNLLIGEEITITYFKDNNKKMMCSIKFKDKTYLDLKKVMQEYKENEKFSLILWPSVIVATFFIAIILFIINYIRNYKKQNKGEN